MENQLECVLCEHVKFARKEFWDKEHIVSYAFGNDGNTDAILEYIICKCCNNALAYSIDTPFLRHVKAREIRLLHGMKRRKKRSILTKTGSGFCIRYETGITHVLECLKIAFETHIKFLGEEYRDALFHDLRKFLLNVISDHNSLCSRLKQERPHGRTAEQIWAETGQMVMCSKNGSFIEKNVYRLDELFCNPEDFTREVISRSSEGTYASLIQLCCGEAGIFVIVALQSYNPLAIRVSNEVDRYIQEYGLTGIHVMDLRSTEKWVGFESLI